jgi:hypothetical protein
MCEGLDSRNIPAQLFLKQLGMGFAICAAHGILSLKQRLKNEYNGCCQKLSTVKHPICTVKILETNHLTQSMQNA